MSLRPEGMFGVMPLHAELCLDLYDSHTLSLAHDEKNLLVLTETGFWQWLLTIHFCYLPIYLLFVTLYKMTLADIR